MAKVEFNILPSHIGFIMDGNGRWAQEKNMPRLNGHDQGAKTVKRIVKYAIKYKIKVISLYAFSTENWNRPEKEISHLCKLLEKYFTDSTQDFIDNQIHVRVMGDVSKFPSSLCEKIEEQTKITEKFNNLVLNIGLNYGSRDEIVKAVNKIISSGIKEIDEKTFNSYLYSCGLCDPDIIVRTSGEKRLSNFMLFQSAYSELYFTDVLWPDFKEHDFVDVLKEYAHRNRRFGSIK